MKKVFTILFLSQHSTYAFYILALFYSAYIFSLDIFNVLIIHALYFIIFIVSDNRFLTLDVWECQMKANWICWINCISSTEYTYTLIHTHILMNKHCQDSCKCSKVAAVSNPIYSSKSDTCKCINLHPVFTLILIYYDSIPYLFQGDK